MKQLFKVRTVFVIRGDILSGTASRGTVDHPEQSHDNILGVLYCQRGHPSYCTESGQKQS